MVNIHFGHLKMLSFKGRDNLGSWVSCFRCVTPAFWRHENAFHQVF